MKDQLQTIREGLERATRYTMLEPDALAVQQALTALTQIEAAVGEQEPVAWVDKHGMVTHDPFEGVTPLYTAPQPKAEQQEPVAWVECDGELVWNNREAAIGRNLYTAASVAQQEPVATVTSQTGNPDISMSWWHEPALPVGTKLYTAAPVAQQPQEIEVQCPVCNHKFHEWPNDKQPQAEAITENTSDGYHTFKELYAFRKAYNAALFNEWAQTGKCQVHKSWRHHDGELCFGGGWFIVVAILPNGQISNHYEAKDWELFNIPETDRALYEFDGHTGADVIARLAAYKGAAPQQAEQRPIQECYGDCPTDPKTCANPCKFSGRPAPQQAEAVPLLSDEDIGHEAFSTMTRIYADEWVADDKQVIAFARAIEQAVRAKCGIVGKEGGNV